MQNYISVVIPLYNKERHIARAINSVLSQTCQNFELIVVDDGSTDHGCCKASEFVDERIRIIHQTNSGVSAARNRGIAESKYDLIAFLDADDEWLPNFLEEIISLHSKYPNCGAYTSSYHFYRATSILINPVTGYSMDEGWSGIINDYFDWAKYDPPFCASSVVIPKTVITSVGGFPEGVKLGEDLDTWLRIAIDYPFCFSNKPLVRYYQDAQNRACLTYQVPEVFEVINTSNYFIKKELIPEEIKRSFEKYRDKMIVHFAYLCIIGGKPVKARKVLAGCSGLGKLSRKWLWWGFWSLIPAQVTRFCYKVQNAIFE